VALTFVAAGTAANANYAAVTPGLPAGRQSGDWLLCLAIVRDATATLSIDQGYSTRWSNLPHVGSDTLTMCLFQKVDGGSEVAPTVTPAGGEAGDDVIAQVCAFRPGANETIAFDSDSTTTSLDATGQDIGPLTGFTPINNNAVVIVCGAKADNWTSVADLTGDGLTWAEIGEPAAGGGTDAGMVWDYAIISGAPVAITDKTFVVTGGVAHYRMGKMTSLYPVAGAVATRSFKVLDGLSYRGGG
jgi:hypothetical protein